MTPQERTTGWPNAVSPCNGESGATPLGVVADEAVTYLRQQLSQNAEVFPRLEDLPESVCIKNSKGVVVYSNEAHRINFSPDASPVGRTAHAYHDARLAARVEVIERLILDSCPYIECEHTGPGPGGMIYRMLVHKRSLRSLGVPGYALFGVIRILERGPAPEAAIWSDLDASAERFREMATRDQEICRLTVLGVSSRELGERLGMTTRGIELRKQKAFARLGVAKAVELARLLTRLQDRGHLDLGL